MSRTYKDRGKHRKIVRNSFVQKVAKEWADDFGGTRGKHRNISKKIRSRLEIEANKEIKENEWL